MKRNTNKWKFLEACADGQTFKIEGINVWGKNWINQKESAEVTDPKYGGKRSFSVYKIKEKEKEIEFAAGEFSNCVWGFYVRKH